MKLPMPPKEVMLFVKAVLVVYILASPLIDYKYLSFLNNVVVKVLLLAVIVAACFVDFQLALIATIAFLILSINLNNNILMSLPQPKPHVEKFYNQPSPLDLQFASGVRIPPEVDQTQNLVCQNTSRSDINKDLLGLYIDDKVKPYDVFIKMMTNEEALSKAQGELI